MITGAAAAGVCRFVQTYTVKHNGDKLGDGRSIHIACHLREEWTDRRSPGGAQALVILNYDGLGGICC